MTAHSDHDPATAGTIEFRDELLGKGWRDDRRVAEHADLPPGQDETAYAIHARTTGALLGVWSVPQRRFIYPDFQFNGSGTIREDVPELLSVLPPNIVDRGGWRRAFWLYSPHALLDGETPADVFAIAPIRVIIVAREEFLSDSEASW